MRQDAGGMLKTPLKTQATPFIFTDRFIANNVIEVKKYYLKKKLKKII